MNNQYTKQTKKHFMNPKNMGEIKNADAIGEAGNIRCGDQMKIYLKMKDNKIKDIKFQTYGCVAAIASTDVVCDLVKGKTIRQAKAIKKEDIVKALGGLPAIKVHCSVLGEEALKKAIEDYEGKSKHN